MNVTQLIQTTKMKLKAKNLVKRFIEIPSLRDKGGMDPDVAKECAVIAATYLNEWVDAHKAKIEKELSKLLEVRPRVNYATKDGVIL